MRRRAIAAEIKVLRAQLQRPRFVRIQSPVLIHEHRAPGSRGLCPCCGSSTAEITETREGEDLILDLDLGDRYLHEETDPDHWRDLVALATFQEVPLRMSRPQAELVLDPTDRHLFASGGNRSAKTTAGLYWLGKQWILRGGRNRRFWLVASTLPKAYRLLEKLFKGTGESPPILPSSLVEYMPATPRASDLQTRLVDGSLIDLKYFEGDPGAERLKSDSIVAGLVDEAAHLPGPDSLVALRGRCLDAPGRLFFASTPRPTSFLKEEVVQPALSFEALPEGDEHKVNQDHPGARWLFRALPLLDNPWLDRATVEKDLKSLKPDDPAVARDFYGSWVSGNGLLWRDFEVEKHVIVNEARDFSGIGLSVRGLLGVSGHVDITKEVAAAAFDSINPFYKGIRATNFRYILGTDVNCFPMTTVAIQITAPKDCKGDRSTWHYWVWDNVRTTRGGSQGHAELLASSRLAKVAEPGGSGSPFAGCGLFMDAESIGRDPTVHLWGGDPKGMALLFGQRGFDIRPPEFRYSQSGKGSGVNPNRRSSHMQVRDLLRSGRLHIHQRCNAVIESFLRQEDAGNGDEPIKVHEIASAMDALRYGLWGSAHSPEKTRYGRL